MQGIVLGAGERDGWGKGDQDRRSQSLLHPELDDVEQAAKKVTKSDSLPVIAFPLLLTSPHVPPNPAKQGKKGF